MNKAEIFPYKPKRNIVVFGQRDAWYKGIKQCLINVKIVCDPVSNRNYESFIKKADVVWVHPKMSHSLFNKIKAIAKKLDKPFLYLDGRGGENSAVQIYNFEEKGEYNNKYIRN